jgi:selenocysteine-specific elongation factor
MSKTLILGTAGHIDHGKTSLVKALTGIDTDRLKEEKERGITIELGFAHIDLPQDIKIGIVDVPGHEKFVKQMVAGVTGMDMVALVIAADEGVMPQTREHLEICKLLQVKSGLTVLTKKDMVDEDWLMLVESDVRDFLKGGFLENSPIVKVSSRTGEGIEELKQEIFKIALNCPAKDISGPFRLPIDRIFTIKGFGTVVTGTSISGQIKVGDPVEIMPKRLTSRVRAIQNHGVESEKTTPGARTAINLHSIEKEHIERGDVVSNPGTLLPSFLLDLELHYLSSCEKALKHRAPVRFHVGTTEVMARILLGKDSIEPGAREFVQIRLDNPVAVLRGDPFVIRSYSPVMTIGGGIILNPLAKKRKKTKPEHWHDLSLLSSENPHEIILYHLKGSGYRGLTYPEISMRTAIFGKKLEKNIQALLSQNEIIQYESDGIRFLSQQVYKNYLDKVLAELENFHRINPLLPGMSKEELKNRIFPYGVELKIYQKILSDLEKLKKVKIEKDIVSVFAHKVLLKEDMGKIKDDMEMIFKRAGLETPSKDEAFKKFDDQKTSQEVFDILRREGILIILKDNVIFHRDNLKNISDKVIAFLKNKGEINIADFKEISGGLSRKYMIPILEYLDNQKVTIRVGDIRKLRSLN